MYETYALHGPGLGLGPVRDRPMQGICLIHQDVYVHIYIILYYHIFSCICSYIAPYYLMSSTGIRKCRNEAPK